MLSLSVGSILIDHGSLTALFPIESANGWAGCRSASPRYWRVRSVAHGDSPGCAIPPPAAKLRRTVCAYYYKGESIRTYASFI